MTFGVYIGGFQVIFGSKRGFFDQFCGHFMSFLWVEGLCRGIGQKSRFWTYRALQWSDDVHTRSTLEVWLVPGLGGFRGRNYASGVEINSELVKLTVNLEGSGGV